MGASLGARRLRELVATPERPAPSSDEVTEHLAGLAIAPPDGLLEFVLGWGGLSIVPVYPTSSELGGEDDVVAVQVHALDELEEHDGDSCDDALIDVSRIAPDGHGDLRAIVFAWLGADPSEGELWWWRDGDRSGFGFHDERARVHPVAGDAFDVVLAVLTGAGPFAGEYPLLDEAERYRAVPHDELLEDDDPGPG